MTDRKIVTKLTLYVANAGALFDSDIMVGVANLWHTMQAERYSAPRQHEVSGKVVKHPPAGYAFGMPVILDPYMDTDAHIQWRNWYEDLVQ